MSGNERISNNDAREEAARALCDISMINTLALADGTTPSAVRRRLLRFVAGVPMPPPPPQFNHPYVYRGTAGNVGASAADTAAGSADAISIGTTDAPVAGTSMDMGSPATPHGHGLAPTPRIPHGDAPIVVYIRRP